MKTENTILVVGPAWIGDMVMAQSLFKLLKQENADITIDVLAASWCSPLLKRMSEVNRVIELPFKHGELRLRERYNIAKSLRGQYACAIVIPRSLKAALIPYWAKIPKRTGILGECRWGLINDKRIIDKKHYVKMVERYLSFGLAADHGKPTDIPQPELQIDPENLNHLITKFKLERDPKPILGLCPGAEYGPAKRWPIEHFATVANEYLTKGWQVYLFGSEKDCQYAELIQQKTQHQCIDFTGKTSLADAIDLLSLTRAVVSNDSGLMHIACALDKSVIALYGSSDYRYTPPLSDKAKIQSLNLSCSPCFKRECRFEHYDCLNQLQPQTIIKSIRDEYA